MPIANTCSIGYPHDGRANNTAYRHDRRADYAANRHDRRADSLSHLKSQRVLISLYKAIFLLPVNVWLPQEMQKFLIAVSHTAAYIEKHSNGFVMKICPIHAKKVPHPQFCSWPLDTSMAESLKFVVRKKK